MREGLFDVICTYLAMFVVFAAFVGVALRIAICELAGIAVDKQDGLVVATAPVTFMLLSAYATHLLRTYFSKELEAARRLADNDQHRG